MAKRRPKTAQDLGLQVLPFGMTWERPIFKRARSIAMALFEAYNATIVLFRDGRVWRSIDPERQLFQRDLPSAWIIDNDKALWIEDATVHPLMSDSPWVTGEPHLRFYAGAPIRLSDGSILGVICVVGQEPRVQNPRLLARLEDVAAMIAADCDHARDEEVLIAGGKDLRNTKSLLSALIDGVPISLMMTDNRMQVLKASWRWLNDIGVTEEETVGRSIYEIMPVFETFRPFYERVLAGEKIRSERVKWVRPDGAVRWLRTELTPWCDHEGKIGGLISAALDITDTVEALLASERAEQRMNLAAEMADLLVWDLDYTRRELVISGAMEQAQEDLFGYTLTYEGLYNNTFSTIHPDDRAQIADEWDKAVAEDRKYVPEYRIARVDDKEVWATCSVKLIRNKAGKAMHLIGAMQNITERKKAEVALLRAKEEAEAANLAKSAFLATMSHEIRTPLNGVLGMAQAMAADGLEDVQRERLGVIRQSGETLLTLLNDVLDLSKIEAGKLELETAEFDVGEVARNAYSTFQELATSKGLALELTVDEAASGIYLGDVTRLRQILFNLLSNAIKFTETGMVGVDVARLDSCLKLSVRDTGIGVDPERLSKIFDKFEQADTSMTRRYGGTGLGLAICRELAELMGGAITATSVLGEGTRFDVILPLPRVDDSRPQAEPLAGPAQVSDAGQLRVLAAEDNAINRMVLKTLLAQGGVEVEIVEDGEKAVQAWRTGEWDLILMDVQMPRMDGPAATRLIRAEEAANGRPATPIIALTANAMAHHVAEYRACGMDDFVAKPIEIGLLFAAMERILQPAEPEALAS